MVKLTDFSDDPSRGLRLLPEWALIRKVLYLGSFVMLAMLTQYFVNAADNLMVGRLDDPAEATASQAALGLGMPLYWAVGGFFAAISYGAQAMTGRRFAEGEEERAGQVLFNAVFVALIAGALGGAVGWFSGPYAVDFLAEASEEQKQLGTVYVQLRALGIGAMVVTFAFKAFFDGIGRTYVHLVAAVVMNLFNIGLNYLLIYGNEPLGIPRMGIAGAGWASMIATYLGLAIMIGVSLAPRYSRRFKFFQLRNFDPKVITNIIKLMLPAGSASLILMSGFLLFFKFVGQIDADMGTGNTYSAATKALMDTAALCFMPLLAFGTATATAVSQSLGAGKPNLAARYGWDSVRIGVLAMIPIGIVFWVWPEQIISLWAPNDPAVPAAGAASLRLVATCLPMLVVAIILSQSLYGAGANTYVMIAEGVLHVGCLVPLSWFLGPHLGFGMEGMWTAAIIYVNGLGLAMGGKFLAKGWRSIEL
ncbi:multidrug efflux protein [Enhygromyxa salina]|uniref:Multidrug-efflux transporter n=1 Tax=Enhygromyxa salina TaxID=215803 RepID=A0A2S9XCA9_9BACT|nr:MATE family efflux transporter [Enhygromyxa salina]PRP90494.1 multidrug efflux protein [Enhygromyxa salina]